MAMMEEAMEAGMTGQAVCAVVGISERRLREWRGRARQGDYARHAKPAHVHPVNALTQQEEAAIERAVGCAEWADLSCRELSVRIMEGEGLCVSHVTIWEYEKHHGLAGHRLSHEFGLEEKGRRSASDESSRPRFFPDGSDWERKENRHWWIL